MGDVNGSGATPGLRVGAVCNETETDLYFLGYGTFLGTEVPDEEAAGLLSHICRTLMRAVPKLKLDNGEIVWGCECWWGPEEAIRHYVTQSTRRVHEITVAQMRGRAFGGNDG